ncbi:unnamed protein product [Schistosoma rodhaini]|uniref:C-CAP/cofactor C-like domain-containing protein n=1 Tax=Schistosoma rodhaini TaxID=6188 RepID=A0AA85F885_9TREM|nr:unnamed protein product [Schistosoma rodhaini]
MNSNQKSSENKSFTSNVSDNHQTVLDRLTERHIQSQVFNSQRKEVLNSENVDSCGNRNIHENFLQQFTQYKLAIVTDLEDVTKKVHECDLPINERTQFVDDMLARLEHMQNWLNETSMYLTSFDNEQARLELKSLNDLFQEKKTELLPNRKFGFSCQQTTKKQGNVNKSECYPEPSTYNTSSIVAPINNDSVIYDERFSLINITGPKHFIIPNINCSSDSFISQTVYLIDLIDCTIEIRHVFGSLIGRRLKNCKIYAYPISGSVWLDECVNCDLVFACRQLRIHQTSNCRLGLHMASRPIIEQCTNLKVAPYQLVYKSLDQDLSTAGLSTNSNLWHEVDDFSCPNRRLTKTSPNWCIMPEVDWSSLCPNKN